MYNLKELAEPVVWWLAKGKSLIFSSYTVREITEKSQGKAQNQTEIICEYHKNHEITKITKITRKSHKITNNHMRISQKSRKHREITLKSH